MKNQIGYFVHSSRLATLTERFMENKPLWNPCLWTVKYTPFIISSMTHFKNRVLSSLY